VVLDYLSKRNFSRSLLVRMALVIGVGSVLFGGGILYLVTNVIDDFVAKNIENDLVRSSRSVSHLFDNAIGTLMQQGRMDNKVAVRIAQVKSLAEFDDFLRVSQLKGCVVANQKKLVFSSKDLPKPLLDQCNKSGVNSRILKVVNWEQQRFFLYRFTYDAWSRTIIIIQNQAAYNELNQRLYDLRGLIIGLIHLMIVALMIILYYNVGRPIRQMIQALQKDKSPKYRGVLEFEYLSGAFQEMMNALEKASHSKDEFLASMSHELRTPLTSIIGNSEYLSGKIIVPDLKEVVGSIESAGRAQLALVNDILDMSKIESGKFTIDEIPYNHTGVLENVERMVSIRAQDAGLKLVVEQKNRETHQLIGDSQRISQILINLLSNAIKFTEQGKISLTTWIEDQQIQYQVSDTGIGMSPEQQGRLFKRFEQADNSTSRRFGGSGLGLYISMNLAQLMGGTMRATSQLGGGSTFTLSLPYRSSDFLVEEKNSSEAIGVGADEKFTGHVLIAEDTYALQILERRILENMGVTVTTVVDGAEAVKAAMAQPFDLVLMDMQMPVMDGIEATKRLNEQGNQTPIVALTANVMAKHRDQFEQAGCSGFLTKPIEKDDLRAVLRKYLSVPEKSVNIELENIEWDDSFSVGNRLLDEQHQQIVDGINQLVSHCRVEKGQDSNTGALELLSKIERALNDHLKDEEALLHEVNYPQLESHIQSHRHYIDRLSRLFQQEISSQTLIDITRLMLAWWSHHILVDDMAFKPYFKQHEDMVLPVGYRKLEQPKLDEEVDNELIAIFKESTSSYLEQLRQRLSDKDWNGVREVSHTLKGTAASFGFPHCSKLASELQAAIDDNRMELAPNMSKALAEELEQILL
jgi:hemerythrin-like metal-binding protein